MRQIECHLNNQTMKDLIAAHLYSMGVIKDFEEIVDIEWSLPNKQGVRQLRVKFQPEVQVIFHE